MTNKNKSNTSPELLNVTGMKSTENIVEEFQKKKYEIIPHYSNTDIVPILPKSFYEID